MWGNPGDLWYPHTYEHSGLKSRWGYGPEDDTPARGVITPLPSPCVVPEAFFDTILVNGGVYPAVSVPPKRVRFRLLNGSQARFYHLNLYAEASTPGEANLNAPGPPIYQVGTEGGFLPAMTVHPNGIPCPLDLKADPDENTAIADGPFNLLLAPAERADVVIDFNGVAPGSSFILYSDAPAPFPEWRFPQRLLHRRPGQDCYRRRTHYAGRLWAEHPDTYEDHRKPPEPGMPPALRVGMQI